MSKFLDKAKAIGAGYALIVQGANGYTRFYKRGSWDESRNCLMFWNDDRQRWENSSELSFGAIRQGMDWTGRLYDLIDFTTQKRERNYDPSTLDQP